MLETDTLCGHREKLYGMLPISALWIMNISIEERPQTVSHCACPSNLQMEDEALQSLKCRKENNGMVYLTFCHRVKAN